MTGNLRLTNHDLSEVGGDQPCLSCDVDSGPPWGCGGSTVASVPANKLYFGDNLTMLREHVKDESVDLIYLDPPFNSRHDYNVLFTGKMAPGRVPRSWPAKTPGSGT